MFPCEYLDGEMPNYGFEIGRYHLMYEMSINPSNYSGTMQPQKAHRSSNTTIQTV
jgi:hypothetical protein